MVLNASTKNKAGCVVCYDRSRDKKKICTNQTVTVKKKEGKIASE